MKENLPIGPTSLRRMACLRFLPVVFCLVVSFCAAGARPSGQPLVFKGASLESVIDAFKARYGCTFVYSDADKEGVSISAEVPDTDLKSALETVFSHTNFAFRIHDDNVVALRKTALQGQQPQRTQTTPASAPQFKGLVVAQADGMPLAGASVAFEGTNHAVIADRNGQFAVGVPKSPGNVIVSYVGYKTLKISYSPAMLTRNNVFRMEEEVSFIDQVVVQGYGTTTIKDATGSISRLNSREIEQSPMTSSVQSLLQGRAAGVNVQIQSASPTAPVNVIIRGVSTLTGNTQPLWVIDGVPDYSSNTSGNIDNTLFNLNLTDIESIDILKDVSATAIYGSRAANGVVIVTTKHGRTASKPIVEVSIKAGVSKIAPNGLRAMNAGEYKNFITTIGRQSIFVNGTVASNDKIFDYGKFAALNTSQWDAQDIYLLDNAFYGGNTDWWKEMTQNAGSTKYDVSVRGGTEATNYFTSFGYAKQNGVVKGGQSELFSGRLNLDITLAKPLKLGLNLSASNRKTDDKDKIISNIIGFRPDQPAYNADGTINIVKNDTTVENPLLTLLNQNNGISKDIVGTVFLEWTILNGLRLKTQGTINSADRTSDLFNRKGTLGYSSSTNSRSLSNTQSTTRVWDNTLDYFGTFGKHTVVALVGSSIEQYKSNYISAEDSDFPDESILINIGSGSDPWADTGVNASALVSFISRVNYKFDERYLATFTFRSDGSSRFGPDKRWGYFPSGALAWVISEEKFMDGLRKWIPYLKLRGSAGIIGSQNLGYYDYLSLYDAADYNGESGVRPTTLGNPKLQWEQTTSVDVGLDFGLLRERVRGTLGYYSKTINNLIYNGSVPANSSQSTLSQNIGTIANKGLEFDIKVTAIKNNDMSFEVGFNIARNVGRVKKLDGIIKEMFIPYYYEYVKLVEGGRIGDWYGYKWAGRYYQSAEEVYALKPINPTTGAALEYRVATDVEGGQYLMDIDGDGQVTAAKDKTVLGNFNPKLFGGINLSFNYKNFFASALFSYSYGAKRLWYYQYDKAGMSPGIKNQYTLTMDSYNFSRSQSAMFPMMIQGAAMYQITDMYIHDASFLRMNALNLSYRLPLKWTQGTFVSSIEISASGSNLFTITKYPGFDPQGNFATTESAAANQDQITIGAGVDRSIYPATRMFNFGLKFTFK